MNIEYIPKLLTGDLLKALCDMGHGDELVIADANFPAESVAKRLIRLPGADGVAVAQAVLELLPVDSYTEKPAIVMDLTQSDKDSGMPTPTMWNRYEDVLRRASGREIELDKIERYAFYERARNAYADTDRRRAPVWESDHREGRCFVTIPSAAKSE